MCPDTLSTQRHLCSSLTQVMWRQNITLCLLSVCNMHFGSSNLGVTNWELPGRHTEGSKPETNPGQAPTGLICGTRCLTLFLEQTALLSALPSPVSPILTHLPRPRPVQCRMSSPSLFLDS